MAKGMPSGQGACWSVDPLFPYTVRPWFTISPCKFLASQFAVQETFPRVEGTGALPRDSMTNCCK